jgi:Spy/CpxP family protein refolding chaperone
MKISPKLLLTLLSLGLGAVAPVARAADEPAATTVAPDEPKAHGKKGAALEQAQKRLQGIDAAVTLTDDQKQKIKEIWVKEGAAQKDVPAADRRAKRGEAMKAAHDQVRAVLTPEQQAKFDAMPAPGRAGKKGKKAP